MKKTFSPVRKIFQIFAIASRFSSRQLSNNDQKATRNFRRTGASLRGRKERHHGKAGRSRRQNVPRG